MISLALAYLRDRPLTTALNVVLLATSVAMLVLLLQLGSQAGERFERDARGIDLVVGAKGSPLQLILSSVFHVDQPTGNIPYSSLALLRRDPAVARAVPLALGDSFRGYRIVGTDATFADLYGTSIAKGRALEAPSEAVLGSAVAEQTGAQLGQQFAGTHGLEQGNGAQQGHDHAPFRTVGVLEPTGTVIDRLILTSYETVWDVHGIDHDHDAGEGRENEGDGRENDHDHAGQSDAGTTPSQRPQILQAQVSSPQPELTALLVTYRNASGAIRIPSMVNRQTEMQSAVPAIETARLLEMLGSSFDAIRLFAWLLAITGGLAIFVALLNMARTREGDLALLRVMGASRVQVFATILMEGLITAAIGAVLGVLAAHGLIVVAISNFATLDDMGLEAWRFEPGEGALMLSVLVIGLLAAVVPAWRVYNVDPAQTLARS